MAEVMEFASTVVDAGLALDGLEKYVVGNELGVLVMMVLSLFWVDWLTILVVMGLCAGMFIIGMVLEFLNWEAFKSP